MEVAIRAIGTANPEYKRNQSEAAELIATGLNLKPAEKRLLKLVYRSTGIEYRYSVLSDYCKNPGEFEFFPNDQETPFPSTASRMQIYKDNALKLALNAIKNCVTQLQNFHIKEITHLITISCTGMYAPGLDIEIVQELQMDASTQRTSINFMGCYGAFNGLKLAHAICKADPNSVVLIICVEICTVHFQKNMIIDNIISNSIFADGAAAVIIQAKPKQQKYFRLDAFHCDLVPQTNQSMTWGVGDFGFDIALSTYVPEIIEKGIASFVENFKKHHLALSQIDFYAIHPGGIKILQACEKSLHINKEDNRYAYQVLRDYGNMSSPTVLFVLKAIWDDIKKIDHLKTIFSCAFGPGLTLESMFLRAHCE